MVPGLLEGPLTVVDFVSSAFSLNLRVLVPTPGWHRDSYDAIAPEDSAILCDEVLRGIANVHEINLVLNQVV